MVSLVGDDCAHTIEGDRRDVCWVIATIASLAEHGGYTIQQLHDLGRIWRPLGATRLDVWAALLRRAGCRLRLLYAENGQLLELDRPWLRGADGAALISDAIASPVELGLALDALAATDLWATRALGPVGNGASKGWGRAPGHVSPEDDYLLHVMALVIYGADNRSSTRGEWPQRGGMAGPSLSRANGVDGPPQNDAVIASGARPKRAKHRHDARAALHHVIAVTDYMIPWAHGDAIMDDPASVAAPAGA
eukprot:3953991-Prymnesium_polylepis.1